MNYSALNIKNVVQGLVLLTVLIGCQDETIIETNKGSIVGFVTLVDENGTRIQNAADVKVTLDKDHFAMTNSAGRYEFKDIKAGTYHPVFEKSGFGTTKKFNYVFTAGNVPGVPDVANMIQLPTLKVLTKAVEVSGSTVWVSGTLQETKSYYLVYNFYDKPDAKPGDEISSNAATFCCGATQTFNQTLSLPYSNNSVYLGIYAVSWANQNGEYSYYDYAQSVWVNTAMTEVVAPFKVK